jgi:phage FluMu gp28-like protein
MRKKLVLDPKYKKDPVEFALKFLINPMGEPAEPHPAQIEMMRGVKKLTVACCGRQLGKSIWLGWYIVWFACVHPNREIYIIAPSVDQSRIIFHEVARQFQTPILKNLLVGKIKEYPFPQINLSNGSRIHGRGANNPQFIRGKPIHLAALDESAFFKDRTIATVIEPMFTVTGQSEDSALIMISTPFGLGDFYEYAQKAQKQKEQGKSAAFFHFTSYDNPFADKEYLDEVRDTYGEDSLIYRSEYLAEFVDGELAVFPWSSIKWAVDNHPFEEAHVGPKQGHRYVQGVDLANIRDYFVASVLDITDPSLVSLVRYDRAQKLGYTRYKSIVRSNYKSYNCAKTLIDATSLGESVAEDLRDVAAEGYKLSNQSKYEIIQELARMLSEHRLTIPNDRIIIDELRYFTYFLTPSKNLKMEASKGHDDIVMSLALAAHLAYTPSSVGWFRGVGLEHIPPTKEPIDFKNYKDPFKELFELDE